MKRMNLKLARIKAGFSISDFSKAVNLTNSMICNIENGKKDGSYKTWLKIQEVLGLENSEMWDLYQKQE